MRIYSRSETSPKEHAFQVHDWELWEKACLIQMGRKREVPAVPIYSFFLYASMSKILKGYRIYVAVKLGQKYLLNLTSLIQVCTKLSGSA